MSTLHTVLFSSTAAATGFISSIMMNEFVKFAVKTVHNVYFPNMRYSVTIDVDCCDESAIQNILRDARTLGMDGEIYPGEWPTMEKAHTRQYQEDHYQV